MRTLFTWTPMRHLEQCGVSAKRLTGSLQPSQFTAGFTPG